MIDVVVPVFNQLELTSQCINCLAYQRNIGRIIVVDDASDDPALVEYLTVMAMDGRILVFRNDENVGFVDSVNRGMEHVETEYGVIVNSDAAPIGENALFILVAETHTGKFNVAGAKLLFMDKSRYGRESTIQHAGVGFNPDGVPYHPFMHLHKDTRAANITRSVTAVTGAVFAVNMDVWNDLDGFDREFAPGVYEDVDYCLRAGRVLYVAKSEWFHKMHGSQTDSHDLFTNSDAHLNLLLSKWGVRCDEVLYYGI